MVVTLAGVALGRVGRVHGTPGRGVPDTVLGVCLGTGAAQSGVDHQLLRERTQQSRLLAGVMDERRAGSANRVDDDLELGLENGENVARFKNIATRPERDSARVEQGCNAVAVTRIAGQKQQSRSGELSSRRLVDRFVRQGQLLTDR